MCGVKLAGFQDEWCEVRRMSGVKPEALQDACYEARRTRAVKHESLQNVWCATEEGAGGERECRQQWDGSSMVRITRRINRP